MKIEFDSIDEFKNFLQRVKFIDDLQIYTEERLAGFKESDSSESPTSFLRLCAEAPRETEKRLVFLNRLRQELELREKLSPEEKTLLPTYFTDRLKCLCISNRYSYQSLSYELSLGKYTVGSWFKKVNFPRPNTWESLVNSLRNVFNETNQYFWENSLIREYLHREFKTK